jgi:SnoaL-like domain
MNLSKIEILRLFKVWLTAWDEHNLDGVMELLHEDIVFENWTGAAIIGKSVLRKSWAHWFSNHGNFRFIEEDIFFDEQEQKLLFRWRLEWPSLEKNFKGKPEIRRGVDVLHFLDGKIYKKYTYSKTTIQIDSMRVSLYAPKLDYPNKKES